MAYLAWLLLAFGYLFILFWLAKWGDKNSYRARKYTSHALVYSLALAIYCTAWTFFGAVGSASRSGWMYLPILIGPMMLYLFGHSFISKLIYVSKKQNINTIADFIASRYGKRQVVGLMVTLIALLATIPYIALQLKAIGASFALLTGQQNYQGIVIGATIFIAFFAIFFGTKQTDVTEYRRGLMLAISFESVIKLLALITVAWVGYRLYQQPAQVILSREFYAQDALISSFTSLTFWAQTLTAAAAVVCLPRQFHVSVIDNLDLKHLTTARWVFPLYLLLIALVIPVIAAVGQAAFAQTGLSEDNYVLGIALDSDSIWLQVLVFIGGLSAATAMIIVATLTLSTMLTNDVILPKLLIATGGDSHVDNYGKRIRLIRRVIIGVILFMAYTYQQQMTSASPLSAIGLIAFSLVIQLLPAIIGGLYWKKGHAHGVYAGLLAGLIMWIFWLILPFSNDLLAMSQSDLLSQGAVASLLVNALMYVIFSKLASARLIDKIQAEAFVSPAMQPISSNELRVVDIQINDLVTMLSTFMGSRRAQQLLHDYEQHNQLELKLKEPPNNDFIEYTERSLAGVIGAASAKAIIDSIVSGKKLDFTEVVNFFDSTTQAIQFNMTALLTALESIDQGISVIDKDLNLVAWNRRYVELFHYPENFLQVGMPIEKIMRYNAERGELGPGNIDEMIQRRMSHLRDKTPHRFTRQRTDGSVVEMIGNPLPGGGFVTSFNDITSFIEIQTALADSNVNLESRVKKRTAEVHSINAELRLEIERRSAAEQKMLSAKQAAEEANNSKTRFLSMASHDIIQPLNAAKLYLTALEDIEIAGQAREIIQKLSYSVNNTEALISALLDISRLDQGQMQADIGHFNLQEVLAPLFEDMRTRAEHKGIVFKHNCQLAWVKADKTYTYRIMQNLISNAVKYTHQGTVYVTCRTRGEYVVLKVKDSGIGIESDKVNKVFDDFYRTGDSNEKGLGLGLGVVRRLVDNIQGRIEVSSQKGVGSTFTVYIPKGDVTHSPIQMPSKQRHNFTGLRALCVDDKQENLDALQMVLDKWHIHAESTNTYAGALELVQNHDYDLLLLDYHLDAERNGLGLAQEIFSKLGKTLPTAIITAVQDNEVKRRCEEMHIAYLNKPLKPAKLRLVIQNMQRKLNAANAD